MGLFINVWKNFEKIFIKTLDKFIKKVYNTITRSRESNRPGDAERKKN